ncbi:hypothetical protein NMG60_11015751 [Bertholletia excelsa]
MSGKIKKALLKISEIQMLQGNGCHITAWTRPSFFASRRRRNRVVPESVSVFETLAQSLSPCKNSYPGVLIQLSNRSVMISHDVRAGCGLSFSIHQMIGYYDVTANLVKEILFT